MSEEKWKHDDLATDLAAHLRGYARPAMIWTNMQLGPSGSPRPDVYSIDVTYTCLRAMAYEVKISRADFLGDVQSGKALRYLAFAGALTFATPKGLVRKDELPAGAGLIERGGQGWRWAKKPTINPLRELPLTTWLKLLIDGCQRDEGGGVIPQPRTAQHWTQQARARHMLGEDLARLLADRDRARAVLEAETREAQQGAALVRERRAADAQRERDAIKGDLMRLRAELDEAAALVGLERGSPIYAIVRALRALRPECDRARLDDAARTLRISAERLASEASELTRRLGFEADALPESRPS